MSAPNDDESVTSCANCACPLTEDVSIECISRGDEEETWCWSCWDQHCEDLREEGWIGQGDEDDGYGTCERCKKVYPGEGAGSGVIMGCCEGEHCTCETICGYCSFYYEPKGIRVCVDCAEKEGWKEHGDDESESEEDVDDVDAPNHFPYKLCAECSERKSCGSYSADMKWLCETCCAAQEE